MKTKNKIILYFDFMKKTSLCLLLSLCLIFGGFTALADTERDSDVATQESLLDDSIFMETLRAAMICKLIEKRARHEGGINGIVLDDVILWKNLNEKGVERCILERLQDEIRIYLPKSSLCIRYFDPDSSDSEISIPNATIASIKTYAISAQLTKQVIFYTLKELPIQRYDTEKLQTFERMLRILLRPYSLLNIKKQDT